MLNLLNLFILMLLFTLLNYCDLYYHIYFTMIWRFCKFNLSFKFNLQLKKKLNQFLCYSNSKIWFIIACLNIVYSPNDQNSAAGVFLETITQNSLFFFYRNCAPKYTTFFFGNSIPDPRTPPNVHATIASTGSTTALPIAQDSRYRIVKFYIIA